MLILHCSQGSQSHNDHGRDCKSESSLKMNGGELNGAIYTRKSMARLKECQDEKGVVKSLRLPLIYEGLG